MTKFYHLICRNCTREISLDTLNAIEKIKNTRICPQCLISLEKANILLCDDFCKICN